MLSYSSATIAISSPSSSQHNACVQNYCDSEYSTNPKNIDHLIQQPFEPTCNLKSNLLINSPYTDFPHLLDLFTLDQANQLLAKALVNLKCLRDDYAISPYREIFNWQDVVEHIRVATIQSSFEWKEQSFYIVVFRSQILQNNRNTLYSNLSALDKAAHAEAMQAGGFLKYWFGTPDSMGRNLATCVWRSYLDARKGSAGKDHIRAAKAAQRAYSEWSIERLKLTIGDKAQTWDITPFNK